MDWSRWRFGPFVFKQHAARWRLQIVVLAAFDCPYKRHHGTKCKKECQRQDEIQNCHNYSLKLRDHHELNNTEDEDNGIIKAASRG